MLGEKLPHIGEMRILEFLSDTVSSEFVFLETIGYFIICLSKKVSIFTQIVLKTINLGRRKHIF